MARGSRRARNYVRDARGRFASTGTTGRKPKPARTTFRQRQAVSLARQRRQTGRLGSATREAKARLKASRRKLATNASPQQKAAVTRAARMAAALAGQRRIKAGPQAGVLRGAMARGVKKAKGARVRNVRGDGMSKGRPGQLARALGRAEANRQRLGAKKEPSRKLDNGYAVNTEAASLYSRRSRSTSRAANLLPVSLPVNAGKKVVARRMAALRGKAPDTAKGKGKGKGTSRKRVKGGEGAAKAQPERKGRSAKAVARTQKQRIAQYERVQARLREQIKKTEYNPSASPSSKFSREEEIGRMQRLSALRNRERTTAKWLLSTLKAKPKPTRPTSKVAAPGSRRKVKGPKMAGTMKPPLLTSRMIKVAGGSRWQKNGMDRIYFNNLAKKGGLEYDTYKSGSIASASLRGKSISNTKAGEILGYLRDSKVFFDRGTRRMVIKPPYATGARQAQQRTAESMLRRAVAEITRDARMPVKKPRKKRG